MRIEKLGPVGLEVISFQQATEHSPLLGLRLWISV